MLTRVTGQIMSGSPNAGTPSSPAPNRPTHSSAAFLHHLHTDPTSHHITLSATGSRLGSGASKSPASAPFPLQAVDLENVQTAAAPLKLPDKPPITPPSRSEPVAGPSSLKAIGRIPSRGERPKTAPVIPGEGALPRIEPSPESSAKMQSRRSSEDRYLMEEPLEDLAHPPNHDEILALHEAGPLVVTGDACIATFMTEESGASEAGDLMPMSAGDSRLFLLGRGGSLRSPEVQPGPMESPPVEQTSWKTFSKAYSQGMFDPNKIPNPPRATMSPLDPPSARSSPGRHYSSMPPAQSDATSRSGSRAFSSASGSSGATTSTQASSAPPTSAANTNPSVVRGQSSINLSLAARRKAREVENRPSIPIRPDHLSIPSYTLAAATVRMATRLRDADFAPLGMPSPERELMDPMASVMPGATATRKDPSSDPGSSRLHLSRSMSSAIDALSNLPTIQGSPVSTPSEHSPKSIAKPLPELNPRRTSPQRSRGGIVNNRIAPASAPIERTIETENTTDYFGSAPPHFARRTSFTSQSSSSRTTVQGTPMPPIPTGGADSPPVSPDFDAEPPRIALPQDIGALYEQFGWLPAPLPPNEAARRRALYRFNILHTTSDPNFDRIAHMAKLVFSSKIVMIALIDNETQWHKAQSGMDSDQGARISSFCSHSVLSR